MASGNAAAQSIEFQQKFEDFTEVAVRCTRLRGKQHPMKVEPVENAIGKTFKKGDAHDWWASTNGDENFPGLQVNVPLGGRRTRKLSLKYFATQKRHGTLQVHAIREVFDKMAAELTATFGPIQKPGEAAKDKWCKIVFTINLHYNSNVF